jgi:hypothetical protein
MPERGGGYNCLKPIRQNVTDYKGLTTLAFIEFLVPRQNMELLNSCMLKS